ncbi:MAG: hypothetical protein IKG25_02765 [Mogibacterium sp.]|nr:hypothetical protein [Mogibacterium sp.]
MANNYTITFRSLRAGTVYTVSVGGGTGTAIPLKGGAQPFTTQEDNSDDMFTPIRTQSGYLRIVDDGKDANGNALAADWWKDLVPANGTDRPVTLTHEVNNTTIVDWQGFMQAQSFSGALYGNPQEREFPVQCGLAALNGERTNYSNGLKNFAFAIKEVLDVMATKSDSVIQIDTIMIQGGADARQWLLNRIDWMMFASEDSDGELQAKNTLIDVLNDVCQFWGWTARIKGKTFYLTCADDSAEQGYLQLTRAQLNTLAAATTDTTTGTVIVAEDVPTVTLSDTAQNPIFVSTNQTDVKMIGAHKAEVKASINQISEIIAFAPQKVRDMMEQGGYTWVDEGENTGYFTTPAIYSFTSDKLIGSANSTYSGFCRRQIYSESGEGTAAICDMILCKQYYNGNVFASLQSTRQMPFSSGSLKFNFSIYDGCDPVTNDYYRSIIIRIGIGMTRASAKWLHLAYNAGTTTVSWTSSPTDLALQIDGKYIYAFTNDGFNTFYRIYSAVSFLNEFLYGYLFVDIMGTPDKSYVGLPPQFQIADFTVSYVRAEEVVASGGHSRKVTKDRTTTAKYSAYNTNASIEEWNADCIFATDNNLEYGYGLLIDGSGNIVATVGYNGTNEHPEQHLANRVANYWNVAKRKMDLEVRSNALAGSFLLGDITPYEKVSVESITFHAISIGRNWRDDITTLSLLQI